MLFILRQSRKGQFIQTIGKMQIATSSRLEKQSPQAEPPKTKYKKVNAYSHPPAIQQIITLFIFVVLTGLFSGFAISGAIQAQSPILWVIIGTGYTLLILIIGDYIVLTRGDPVDRRITGEITDIDNCQWCLECNGFVHKTSYHCNTCKRCVEYFDHHCKYLNNCIGGNNYHQFLRLLCCVTGYCLVIIGSNIWTFAGSFIDPNLSKWGDSGLKWGSLVTLLLGFFTLIAVDSLLCFHLYLNFCIKKTTLQFLVDASTSTNSEGPPPPQTNGNIQIIKV